MRQGLIAAVAVSAAIACGKDQTPVARPPARPDSASGEVAQYALMKNNIGWLTDSNVVALASQVNADAQGTARLESQAWTKEPLRLLAGEILRDHARMQVSIDSIASVRHIPPQMPAVAPEMKAAYDSLLSAQSGLPMADREARFVDLLVKEHQQSMTDFAALGGNSSDVDLKALLANRAVLMEQTHIARAKLMADAMAKADSAHQDSLKTKRGGAGR